MPTKTPPLSLLLLLSTCASLSSSAPCFPLSRSCECADWWETLSFGCECDAGHSSTSGLCRKDASNDLLVPSLACLSSDHCHVANVAIGGFCERGYERDLSKLFEDVCVSTEGRRS
jgi:hypothetical protein